MYVHVRVRSLHYVGLGIELRPSGMHGKHLNPLNQTASLRCSFNLQFLLIKGGHHFFRYLLAIYISSFENCIQFIIPFINCITALWGILICVIILIKIAFVVFLGTGRQGRCQRYELRV